MNAGRRNRVALSTVEVKGPRRSSILKKPEMTPDKENAANSRPVPASGRKSSLGGGDKKRRVSFSHTDQVHTITPTKAGPETKRSILRKAEPTPQLEDLLDESGVPHFDIDTDPAPSASSVPVAEENSVPLNQTGEFASQNYTMSLQFGQSKILPNSHVVSIDSIFGDDIDASVIVPKHRTAQSSAATFASQSLDMDQGEKTADKWGALDMEKELELSGAAGAGGALDSKTYDFASATAGPRTINAAADMSLATNTQGFDPRTIRLDANMSVVQEESDSGRSSSGKMSNLAEAMQVDEDEEEEEEDALNETAAGATQQGAKTVNFAADMDMSLATAQFAGARTVNLDMPMDIEEEDEEKKSSEQDEDVEQQREAEEEEMTARDRLNQGFTKDWAADARTVNFAAPMDVEEEEEDEEDDEEADIRTQWNLNTTSHMAAADAVRKSLEMGELMGRSSLGRRSMDRLSSGAERLSFGRSSPKRESLSNRESLLSPVEETGEPEEEMSPLTRPAAPLPSAPVAVAPVVLAPVAVAPMPPKKALPVPPKKKEAPAKQRAAVATERPPMGGRVMVEHPIAGVQVAVPQSRLPGLFDRRYSTRRIIRNFGHELPSMSDDGDAAEEMDVEEEVAVHESFAVAAEPTRKRRAADEDSVVDNARRASMRQSIAPGELPMSDFLWLANVRFAEEQPVQALAPAVAAPVPSLCSTEIAALEREMELLLAAGETLKAEIAAEERSLMSSDNPLFTAMQTSDQAVLVAAQSDLAELKRLCLLQAETEALSAAVSLSAGARSNFRQVGERAVRDTRTIYQQTGLMHMEREKLRSARIAALEEICVMREQQQRQQKNAAAATGSAKLMASVFEALTHCSVVLSEENRTEVVICEAVRLVVGQATVECSLVDNIDAWRANLIRATGVLGRTARLPEASLQSLVEPVRAKMLRCNAGAKELRSLARRINVVYPDSNDMVDIYFSSKSAMAILHIPCAAIAAYPSRSAAEGGAPTVTVLKSSGDASRLLAVVREGCSGVGCFAQLCSRVAQEFQRL